MNLVIKVALSLVPNLTPPIPTPFASDGFVICSGKDRRLKSLAANAGNATSLTACDRSALRVRATPFTVFSFSPLPRHVAEDPTAEFVMELHLG